MKKSVQPVSWERVAHIGFFKNRGAATVFFQNVAEEKCCWLSYSCPLEQLPTVTSFTGKCQSWGQTLRMRKFKPKGANRHPKKLTFYFLLPQLFLFCHIMQNLAMLLGSPVPRCRSSSLLCALLSSLQHDVLPMAEWKEDTAWWSGVLWGGRTHKDKGHHIPAPHLEANHQLFGSETGVHLLPSLLLHPPQWKRQNQGFSVAVGEVPKGQLKFHHSSLHFPLGHWIMSTFTLGTP